MAKGLVLESPGPSDNVSVMDSRKPKYHKNAPKIEMNPGPQLWLPLLRTGLSDDAWHWDWTALATLSGRGKKTATARMVAKSNGVYAGGGLPEALEILAKEMGSAMSVKSRYKQGQELKVGSTVMEWRGDTRLMLALERPALNLLSYVSGIATATQALQARLSKSGARVTSTRKILPAYRDLALLGVLAGGGFSHRVNLAGGVLIKENHIVAVGGVKEAVRAAHAVAPHGLRVECEIRTLQDLREALSAGVDAVLLDNFSPSQVRAALSMIQNTVLQARPLVEVSGGINADTIAGYDIEGVDVISVGSITHSVKAVDYSLLFGGLSVLKNS